jgi:hypothetical protein
MPAQARVAKDVGAPTGEARRPPRVLVVDDEVIFRLTLAEASVVDHEDEHPSRTIDPSSPAFSAIWRIGDSSARRTMLMPTWKSELSDFSLASAC